VGVGIGVGELRKRLDSSFSSPLSGSDQLLVLGTGVGVGSGVSVGSRVGSGVTVASGSMGNSGVGVFSTTGVVICGSSVTSGKGIGFSTGATTTGVEVGSGLTVAAGLRAGSELALEVSGCIPKKASHPVASTKDRIVNKTIGSLGAFTPLPPSWDGDMILRQRVTRL
jgi:hypothetical protein